MRPVRERLWAAPGYHPLSLHILVRESLSTLAQDYMGRRAAEREFDLLLHDVLGRALTLTLTLTLPLTLPLPLTLSLTLALTLTLKP